MNITTQRFLKLCLCLGGSIFSIPSLAIRVGDGKTPKYSVQHFDTFRKLTFNKETLVIDRGYFRNGQLIYFARGDSNLIVDIKNGERKYRLTRKLPGKKIVLNANLKKGERPRISYIVEKDRVHYNLSGSNQSEDCLSKELTALIGRINAGELKQVDSFVYAGLIDIDSCRLNEKNMNKLIKAVSDQFTPNRSDLVRCLSDIEAREELSKIPTGEMNAFQVLGKYLERVEEIGSSSPQLEVKCSDIDERASLKEGPPTQITLPTEDGELISPQADLAHEILHISGLNEDSAIQIKKVCDSHLRNNGRFFETSSNNTALAELASPTQTNETTISNPAIPITEADFAPAPQQAVQALATAPEGSPAFKQGAATTYNSMDRIFNNMNKIAGQILPAANAAPLAAKSNSKNSSGKKVQFAKAGDNDDEIVTEHIELDLNSGNSTNSNPSRSNAATSLREDRGGSNANANANASTDPRTNSSMKQSALRMANRSASPSGSPSGSLSEGINPGGSKNSSLKLAPSRNIASSAQESSSTQGASIKQSQSATPTSTQTKPLDVPSAISTLNSFSQLKGDRYQQLKALYSDPAFQKKLETLKISIQVSGSRAPASQGQRRNLGVNSQVAKTVFIDDGNMLRLVKRSIKGE